MSKTFQDKDIYYLYIWRGEEIVDELILKGNYSEMLIEKIISSTKTNGLIEVYKVDKLNQNFKFHKKITVLNNLELYNEVDI